MQTYIGVCVEAAEIYLYVGLAIAIEALFSLFSVLPTNCNVHLSPATNTAALYL